MLAEQRRRAALEHTRRVLERALQRRAADIWETWVASGAGDPEREPGSPYEIARRLAGSSKSPTSG
jgi:hypothetical protein